MKKNMSKYTYYLKDGTPCEVRVVETAPVSEYLSYYKHIEGKEIGLAYLRKRSVLAHLIEGISIHNKKGDLEKFVRLKRITRKLKEDVADYTEGVRDDIKMKADYAKMSLNSIRKVQRGEQSLSELAEDSTIINELDDLVRRDAQREINAEERLKFELLTRSQLKKLDTAFNFIVLFLYTALTTVMIGAGAGISGLEKGTKYILRDKNKTL